MLKTILPHYMDGWMQPCIIAAVLTRVPGLLQSCCSSHAGHRLKGRHAGQECGWRGWLCEGRRPACSRYILDSQDRTPAITEIQAMAPFNPLLLRHCMLGYIAIAGGTAAAAAGTIARQDSPAQKQPPPQAQRLPPQAQPIRRS